MDKPFIGQLNCKIEIIELTTVQNTIGENKPVETVYSSPWAKMEDLTGSEEIQGKVIHSIVRKYTIRMNSHVLTKGHEMLVNHNGQKFAIRHVKQIGKTHLEINCILYE
jgi:head-tail adaptor